jgi:ABC-2 type transport system ATP-binding protein
MSVVKVENLYKQFGSFHALNGVNMELNEGEIYGFIGPNGAGKSTTIRILLGILKRTEGNATIFGKDVWKDAVDIHKRIAYVPGDVNLWPNLTGGEVLDLFMSFRGQKNTRKKDALVEAFALDPTKKCRTYSKGNRQKVALIAAFASDAELFILDEPTSGLDPLMENIFQEHVLKVKREGKTVLLSSHILSEVEKLCDRVGIIRQGEIIESGTLREMRHLTRTNFTVETKEQITDLPSLKGVHDIEQQEQTLTFQVDAEELDSVIQHISNFGILKLESTPPTLEDLFIRHYEQQSDSGGSS